MSQASAHLFKLFDLASLRQFAADRKRDAADLARRAALQQRAGAAALKEIKRRKGEK